ncbi:SDR family oxidoreductase [Streptomyces boncukensis]|uniref:SDR family oxidoreductase n=1 Tax=Streptomyces boncukensis TaxID=2711219 RepID=A0A6G4X4J7_9ACTN|nr:SDR family oxidoreductase [Streptomyces boncukensis]NGO71777.1 SDR family oxidoreductase [Streptomyces boncukensis]
MTPGLSGIEGKVALVTGASRGIGLAIAEAFLRNGARVAVTARNKARLEAAAAGLRDTVPGAQVSVHPGDAGDTEVAPMTVAEVLDRFGALDILVNNAAINPGLGPTAQMDLAEYDALYQVDQRGPLMWTQEVLRQAMTAPSGNNIINISSAAMLGFAGPMGSYASAKAALVYQTRHLAVELGPRVRVNAIAPGVVKTAFMTARVARHPFMRGRFGADFMKADPRSERRPWPLVRVGQPRDVANAALFLASDLADWITGHLLVVDGGASLALGSTGPSDWSAGNP